MKKGFADVDLGFFSKGVIIGLSIAASVGPIGVLCIRRTLAEGRLAGFVSGMGAAIADAAYGMIAGSGLGWLTLSTMVNSLGKRFNSQSLAWVNKVSGIVILIFGGIALVH